MLITGLFNGLKKSLKWRKKSVGECRICRKVSGVGKQRQKYSVR